MFSCFDAKRLDHEKVLYMVDKVHRFNVIVHSCYFGIRGYNIPLYKFALSNEWK